MVWRPFGVAAGGVVGVGSVLSASSRQGPPGTLGSACNTTLLLAARWSEARSARSLWDAPQQSCALCGCELAYHLGEFALMRVSSRFVMVSLSAVIFYSACKPAASPADSREEALQALRSADSALQVAIAARDLPGTLAFYADDAVTMPLAKPSATGMEAIREEWEHNFGIPDFANVMRLTGAEVSDDGTLGVTRGTYAATMKAPNGQPIVERGKWVSVWRRSAGAPWRITIDIFNTDSLPPDHQASTGDTHDH